MKTKIIALISFFSLSILFLSFEYSFAQSSSTSSKIGIVSIKRVSAQCKATAEYMAKVELETKKMIEEKNKLNTEIKALSIELDSEMFIVGSTDYYQRRRELIHKQLELDYLQNYNPQELAHKDMLWKKGLYKKILDITNKLGDEKGLDLILAVNEPELSEEQAEELGMIVMTHKVLYSGGCIDLTEEVTEKLDKEILSGN